MITLLKDLCNQLDVHKGCLEDGVTVYFPILKRLLGSSFKHLLRSDSVSAIVSSILSLLDRVDIQHDVLTGPAIECVPKICITKRKQNSGTA